MAQAPSKKLGKRVSNIIAAVRGDIDFKNNIATPKPNAYGSTEVVSATTRDKILKAAVRAIDPNLKRPVSSADLMAMVQKSLSKVGQERMENRKILNLMPEVDKAARLMIASVFSPTDLSRHDISVTVDLEGISDDQKTKLHDFATPFFQKKLNLKVAAPSWMYQCGYEAGASVFAIIPLRSFEKIQEESFLGTEAMESLNEKAFVQKVVEPLCHENIFGFGDEVAHGRVLQAETRALESLLDQAIFEELPENQKADRLKNFPKESTDLINKIIGQEALSLTDNPAVLQMVDVARKKREARTGKVLAERYRPPRAEPTVVMDADRDPLKNGGVSGNPILQRLPPESVTIIHTPGDPSDHQAYLILLDHTGSPINAVAQEEASQDKGANYNAAQSTIFAQTFSAYGLNSAAHGAINQDTMNRIYTKIVTNHLSQRLGKAGFNHVDIANVDSVYRCMFSRFMQQKQTRILLLPKDLVTYMALEMDQNGYGISRLDRIKFNLGLKMALQISRVLSSIKGSMDKRSIKVNFTDNYMDNPEALYESIVRQYTDKATMSFSTNPNEIQTQIAEKSLSIIGEGIPGMEAFSLTNEPDNRTSDINFDAAGLEYIDKGINAGMKVPAAAMNDVGENEYARSVTTSNLFFAMDVSIDQDIMIKMISDLLRKYARYSEEFQNELIKIFPSLKIGKKSSKDDNSSTDEASADPKAKADEKVAHLPEGVTIDTIIDALLITLPKPSVAPSKAQFEALESMTSALTNMMTALFPDDMAGNQESLKPVIAALRAQYAATNIRAYLASSGMADIDIPDNNFSEDLGGLSKLYDALYNVVAMMKAKTDINTPAEVPLDGFPGADQGFGGGTPPEESPDTPDTSDTGIPGY